MTMRVVVDVNIENYELFSVTISEVPKNSSVKQSTGVYHDKCSWFVYKIIYWWQM